MFIRTDMHPADQYEAFAKLHTEDGLSAEDIAARFGVTAAVVRQRLKLGAVSPKLMKLYRNDKMSLEQLAAAALLAVVNAIDQYALCFQYEDPPGSGTMHWYRSLSQR